MFYLFSNNFFLNPKILFFIFLVLMEMLEKSNLPENPQIVGLTASMGKNPESSIFIYILRKQSFPETVKSCGKSISKNIYF